MIYQPYGAYVETSDLWASLSHWVERGKHHTLAAQAFETLIWAQDDATSQDHWGDIEVVWEHEG